MSALAKNCLSSSYFIIYDDLNAICKCLDSLYRINDGGCCYVAYCIAQLLERDSIPFDVVVFEKLKEYKLSDVKQECYHIAIRLNSEYIINQGDFELDEYTVFTNVASKDILEYYKRFKWNRIYKVFRNKFIKYVIRLFYENFTSSLREGRSNSASK